MHSEIIEHNNIKLDISEYFPREGLLNKNFKFHYRYIERLREQLANNNAPISNFEDLISFFEKMLNDDEKNIQKSVQLIISKKIYDVILGLELFHKTFCTIENEIPEYKSLYFLNSFLNLESDFSRRELLFSNDGTYQKPYNANLREKERLIIVPPKDQFKQHFPILLDINTNEIGSLLLDNPFLDIAKGKITKRTLINSKQCLKDPIFQVKYEKHKDYYQKSNIYIFDAEIESNQQLISSSKETESTPDILLLLCSSFIKLVETASRKIRYDTTTDLYEELEKTGAEIHETYHSIYEKESGYHKFLIKNIGTPLFPYFRGKGKHKVLTGDILRTMFKVAGKSEVFGQKHYS